MSGWYYVYVHASRQAPGIARTVEFDEWRTFRERCEAAGVAVEFDAHSDCYRVYCDTETFNALVQRATQSRDGDEP